MTSFGLYDGAALRFAEGLLAALDLGRFAVSFELHEEFDIPPGPLGPVLPYLPVETSLDMSEALYRGLDPHTGFQAGQNLAGGTRTISILQGRPVALGSGLVEPVAARVHFDVTVPARLGWRLRLGPDAAWVVEDKDYATARLAAGSSLRLSATGPFAVDEGGRTLSLELPAGASTVELWIEGRPPARLAAALIMCAPNQIREAAVVATCVGSKDGTYIPVLDLGLPSATDQDFQAANARLNEVVQQLGQIEEQMAGAQQPAAQTGG